MLLSYYTDDLTEAGCDEAGRGCLAGPVFAAAVILPKEYQNPLLDDSKKLNARQREELRQSIQEEAVSWAVAGIDNHEIDETDILQASFKAMHKALDQLKISPDLILVDGNRFTAYRKISHRCIVGGDGLYASIAAASILAKTYRDDFMATLHQQFQQYNWITNKGYPTPGHIEAILIHGLSPYHRKSFHVKGQYRLELD